MEFTGNFPMYSYIGGPDLNEFAVLVGFGVSLMTSAPLKKVKSTTSIGKYSHH